MTIQQRLRACTIAAVVAVFAACAPLPGSAPGFLGEIPLPSGPLNQLTSATMRGLQSQVTWVGCDTTARTGKTSGTTTNVEICAAQYAKDVGRGNNNSNGVLMARMVNLGGRTENRWGLTPGDTSFIASFPKDQSQGLYAILQVPAGSSGGTKVTVLAQNGNFIYCGHPQATNSSASFHTCAGKWPAPRRSSRVTTESGPKVSEDMVFATLDGPAWVSCLSGCCTTEAQ